MLDLLNSIHCPWCLHSLAAFINAEARHWTFDRRIKGKNEKNIKSLQKAEESVEDTQNRTPIMKDNFKIVEGNFRQTDFSFYSDV